MPNKKAKGKRAKTRSLFRKKGSKATVNKLLQEIPVGSKVDIKIDGSMHAGIVDKRFHGYTGTVLKKQGSAFVVGLSKGNASVKLIVGPAHLTVSNVGKQEDEVKVAA